MGEAKADRKDKKPAKKKPSAEREAPAAERKPLPPELEKLGLPRDPEAIAAYLANSYKGVGAKTAERIVEAFGDRTFEVLAKQPDRLGEVLGSGRAKALLEQWSEDRARREQGPETSNGRAEPASESSVPEAPAPEAPVSEAAAAGPDPSDAPSGSAGGAGRSRTVTRRGSSRSTRSRS